ncbi:carboxypeptidase D [Blastomyces silverae]|uniref:Carboxypeptidase n=1 Tax=Blastomyces silverae TaxID=2060906 RepID=A0A0H1BJ71_9EURO|nr:carboxypeptidase D [Blastomyces silverae]
MQAFSIWLLTFWATAAATAAQLIRDAAWLRNEALHKESRYLNEKSRVFLLNGGNIPDVPFDIGEAYAGLLPISSDPQESRKLYFWFMPSSNPLAIDEVTIWLNGGPGCSSLEGLFQENGPFIHQYGTFAPVRNMWSWTNLTNMIWVEQPVGTGFTQGSPNITNQEELAAQFLGFFKNFLDIFGFHRKKIYLTGESYAGKYIPYIADAMFKQNDTKYFDVQGTLIYDPSINVDEIMMNVPAVPFVDKWSGLFPFNSSFSKEIHSLANSCGYTSYLHQYLVFPPNGKLPTLASPNVSCNLASAITDAISYINPCFNVYHVATTCPVLWDPLGFPGNFQYVPRGAQIYFNRSDVQQAINAPLTSWSGCPRGNDRVFINGTDTSPPPSYSVLPSVIERSKRTIIAHGDLDFILMVQGTLLTIQNMTWHGSQGFTAEPSDPLFVPYHAGDPVSSLAGAGVMGKHRTERGLTYAELFLTGHMGPQYSPAASYRLVEFMLGRIDDLSS